MLKPNPFDFNRRPSGMDSKLDEILKKLGNVATKEDFRTVTGRMDRMEERMKRVERARSAEMAAKKTAERKLVMEKRRRVEGNQRKEKKNRTQ